MTDELPFECPTCGKRLKSKRAVSNHVKVVHEGGGNALAKAMQQQAHVKVAQKTAAKKKTTKKKTTRKRGKAKKPATESQVGADQPSTFRRSIRGIFGV